MKVVATLFFTFLLMNISAQIDKDQSKAAKEFKSGTYKLYKNASLVADEVGTIDVKVKKDENGNVTSIVLDKREYKLASYNLYGNEKVYGSHFESRRVDMIYMKDKLYTFEKSASGDLNRLLLVIAKKAKKLKNEAEAIKDYIPYMIEAKAKAREDILANLSKTNPDKYYSVLGKESGGLRHVVKDKMHGFIDAENNVVVPLEYEETSNAFYKGITLAKKNGKFGAINQENKTVVPLKHAGISWSISGTVLCVNSDNRYTVYDNKGNLLVDKLDYVEDEVFKDEAVYIKKNSKHGRILKSFEVEWMLDDSSIDKIMEESNAFIVFGENSKVGLLDQSMNPLLAVDFEEIALWADDLFRVKHLGKTGVYKLKSGFITECLYDYEKSDLSYNGWTGKTYTIGEIHWSNGFETPGVVSNTPLLPFRKDFTSSQPLFRGKLSRFKKGGKYGFIDENQSIVVQPIFTSASLYDFDGLIIVGNQNGKGVMNLQQDSIVPLNYDEIERIENGLIVAAKGSNKTVFTTKGIELINDLSEVGSFENGKAKVKKGNLSGVLDITGTVSWGDGTVSHNESFLSNLTWKDQYDEIGNVGQDEYIRVVKSGKVGFVDINGNVKIPLVYQDAQNLFREDKCGVKTDNGFAFIDRQNNVLFTFEGNVNEWGYFYNDRLTLKFNEGNDNPTLKIFDTKGTVLLSIENVNAPVQRKGKYYYISTDEDPEYMYDYHLYDQKGNKMLSQYSIDGIRDFSEGVLRIETEDGFGLVDENDLSVILPPFYEDIKKLNEEYFKFCIKSRSGRKKAWGVCESNGKIVHNAIFSEVKYLVGTYKYTVFDSGRSGEYDCARAPYINGSWYCNNDAVTNIIKGNVDLSLVIVNDTDEYQSFGAYEVYGNGSHTLKENISLEPGEVYHLQGNKQGKFVLSKTTPGYYKGFFEAEYAYKLGQVLMLSKHM
ncbi:MAG: WG repeat-containing protein [Crocinitomicaceae bacterium]